MGSSKSSDTARESGPDNAVTRYAGNLAAAPQKAQDAVDKANAAIARQQEQMNQANLP